MAVWTLLALAVAASVLVLASVASGTDDHGLSLRGYLDDVRAGLRAWQAQRHGHDEQAPVGSEPVDATMDDLFAATTVQDPAYLGVDDLTDTLARARERAARGVSGLSRR